MVAEEWRRGWNVSGGGLWEEKAVDFPQNINKEENERSSTRKSFLSGFFLEGWRVCGKSDKGQTWAGGLVESRKHRKEGRKRKRENSGWKACGKGGDAWVVEKWKRKREKEDRQGERDKKKEEKQGGRRRRDSQKEGKEGDQQGM
mmetsp:Transcript_30998/g.52182  ORF Transcript_30998/g.52182 Transcript_30998/m.52182 type:complete len:145 (+) Transcript_30998:145-579(+)